MLGNNEPSNKGNEYPIFRLVVVYMLWLCTSIFVMYLFYAQTRLVMRALMMMMMKGNYIEVVCS